MDLGLFGYYFSLFLELSSLLHIGHPKWVMSITFDASHSLSSLTRKSKAIIFIDQFP